MGEHSAAPDLRYIARMTAADLLTEVRSRMAAHVDPVYRQGATKFFREPIDLWGVRAPEVKRIARAAYHEVKGWPSAQRDKFATELWESGKLDEANVAIYVYRRFRRQHGAREFRFFEGWIDRYVRNWAACDGVSSWLLSACLENQPELIHHLPAWTHSRNRWKRRSAAVSLLQEAKQGRHTGELLEIASLLLEDPDDMVQKGVGWVLKVAYPKRPREVVGFLKPRSGSTPRLVLRIAAEKMTARDRAGVLPKWVLARRPPP
jgi:3-methyladenine DNA glycosylase AlkD